ncbi:oligosaccharide flippase family protein [Paraconexibacter sp.]|uniref:oligosaccharide flippase family protein n=1 Tax=Paraconexibacter sp. TaxID=2949640 RepID=UPI003566E045
MTDLEQSTVAPRQTSLTRAAALVAAASAFAVTAGLLTGPIIARALAPEGRGALAAIVAPLGLIGLVAQFSASEFVSQHTARGRSTATTIGTVAPVMFAAAVVLAVACWPFAAVIADGNADVERYVELGLIALPFGLLVPVVTGIAIGQGRWTRAALASAIPPWAYAVVIVTLVSLGELTVGTAALATIGVTFAGGLAYVGLRPPPVRRLHFDRLLARAYVSYASRTTPGLIATLANVRLDQILMFGIVGPRELGLYVVAVTVAGISTVVVTPLASVTVPAVAVGEHSLIGRATRMSLAAAAVAVTAVALASYPMLRVLFGSEFTEAEPMLLILLAAQIPTVGTASLGYGLRTVGRPGLASAADFLALIITVPMLLLLLPVLGGEGAALTSLAAYSVTFAALCLLTSREIAVPVRELVVVRKEDLSMVRARAVDLMRARTSRWFAARRTSGGPDA